MRDSARVSSCTGTPPNRLFDRGASVEGAAGAGWVGATLDNDPDWDALERIIADAYALVAAPQSRAKR